MDTKQTPIYASWENLKQGIWLLGLSSWLFGLADRSVASFSDGYLSASDLIQLITASFFSISWLFLKPTRRLKTDISSDPTN